MPNEDFILTSFYDYLSEFKEENTGTIIAAAILTLCKCAASEEDNSVNTYLKGILSILDERL